MRAQEDERRTLARELHDEVGQSLSAIMMEAERRQCGRQIRLKCASSCVSDRLHGREDAEQVRDLALLLRPSMLDDFGLVPALNWHAREMSKRTGLNVAHRPPMLPTICRTSTEPASTALCRKR